VIVVMFVLPVLRMVLMMSLRFLFDGDDFVAAASVLILSVSPSFLLFMCKTSCSVVESFSTS